MVDIPYDTAPQTGETGAWESNKPGNQIKFVQFQIFPLFISPISSIGHLF
jgi:hypothetical protein